MSEFKQCPNGHYYQGATCPYCKSSNGGVNVGPSNPNPTSAPTQVYDAGIGGGNNGSTETMTMNNGMGGERTIVDNQYSQNNGGGQNNQQPMSGRTMIIDDPSDPGNSPETNIGSASPANGTPKKGNGLRPTRKLVGWLVSFTLDEMGVDFKLYEGRNIIGRDDDCNITVNDSTVSAKHAILLYRDGKFAIQDQMSTLGTFVNNSSIDLEPIYLADGDEIKIGRTIFKFRTAF